MESEDAKSASTVSKTSILFDCTIYFSPLSFAKVINWFRHTKNRPTALSVKQKKAKTARANAANLVWKSTGTKLRPMVTRKQGNQAEKNSFDTKGTLHHLNQNFLSLSILGNSFKSKRKVCSGCNIWTSHTAHMPRENLITTQRTSHAGVEIDL